MAMAANVQHAERVQAAIHSDEAAKSALVASWRRSSALHRLDPAMRTLPRRLSDTELERSRQGMESLIHAAQPSLDRLYQAVGGIGCCVLLADHNGVPIERRGHVADDATFRDWGLWPGTVWSEESEGTNGIGTCLAVVGDRDVLLGTIGDTPVYISESQYEAWKHTDLIIDVVLGRGGMFSLDNGREKRFLTRSTVCAVPT